VIHDRRNAYRHPGGTRPIASENILAAEHAAAREFVPGPAPAAAAVAEHIAAARAALDRLAELVAQSAHTDHAGRLVEFPPELTGELEAAVAEHHRTALGGEQPEPPAGAVAARQETSRRLARAYRTAAAHAHADRNHPAWLVAALTDAAASLDDRADPPALERRGGDEREQAPPTTERQCRTDTAAAAAEPRELADDGEQPRAAAFTGSRRKRRGAEPYSWVTADMFDDDPYGLRRSEGGDWIVTENGVRIGRVKRRYGAHGQSGWEAFSADASLRIEGTRFTTRIKAAAAITAEHQRRTAKTKSGHRTH
jgi:hypothetical protein